MPRSVFFSLIPANVLRWRPFRVYAISVGAGDTSPTKETKESSDLTVRWATADDLPKLTSLSPQETIDLWDPADQRAAVAWIGNSAIGIAWISRGTFAEPELGMMMRLQNNEVWLFAAHVLSTHRQQGVYRTMLAFVLRQLASEDVSRVLLGVSLGNVASVKAHECHGASAVGSLVVARAFSCFSVARCNGTIVRESKLPFAVGGDLVFHVR